MLALIAAIARNRVLGKDNQLLWHLPEDMRHFREMTRGKPVIMGRKTWESLPEKFRPLPGRLNIVVSRNPDYAAPGATVVDSLENAIRAAEAQAGAATEIFVIGGAELYRQALPLAQRVYLTEIASDFAGDVDFPELAAGEWQEISRTPQQEPSELTYAFAVYRRR